MLALMYLWWFWLIIMLIFFVPIGYGWGYRGWGPPYPRFIQRRRMQRSTAGDASAGYHYQAWGIGGDLVWGVLLLWAVVIAILFLWR